MRKPEPTEVDWVCPYCGEINLDDYAATACPMCSDCEAEFNWDDILSMEEMIKLNVYLGEV